MKNIVLSLLLVAVAVSGAYAQSSKKNKNNTTNTTSAQVLVTKEDSATYANGFQMGTYFRQNQIPLNTAAYAQGMVDAYTASNMQVTPEQLEELSQYFSAYVQQKMQEKTQKDATYNKEVGKTYMAQNRKSKDIKETASGLQYMVIKEGEGARPVATDKVKVHYEGFLLSGEVFDSSRKRGEPITFGLNQVIPGWSEGVQLMTPGSIYKFWIPSELGYGDRAIGSIPPGSTLIFEVELLEVNPE